MAGSQLASVLRQVRRMMGGPSGEFSDRELLERYSSTGDQTAFTALVERHGSMVLGVCRRILGNDHDADDAFQAVFLVLARKAGTVCWQSAVANWLYGVAYRTASKLRVQRARQRRHETQAGQRMAQSYPAPGNDVLQVLDVELYRLPKQFRLPVLLCCLQDQTVDEAAQQLGWTFATVKSRLQRGRDMLRQRLQRHGVGLSAGVLGTILTEGVVKAVPRSLFESTISIAAGEPIPAAVAALAKGAIQAMLWTKIKIAVLSFLLIGALCLSSGIALHHLSAEALVPLPEAVPGAKVEPPAKASEPAVKDGLSVVVRPVKAVFGPEEQPAFEITYTNQRDKAFRLYDIGYEVHHWTCFDLQMNGPWQVGPWLAKHEVSPPVLVEPGKAHVQKHILRGPFMWQGIQRKPVQPRQSLRPGKYRLTARIIFDEVRDKIAVPYWTGEIMTNEVEFEIAATPTGTAAQPVIKNGLSLTVTPTKAVFAASESPSVEIALKNNSKQEIILPVPQVWISSFRRFLVTDLNTGQQWSAGLNIPANPIIDLKTLEPGETLIQKAVLFAFRPLPEQGKEQKVLEPGLYKASVILSFSANNQPPGVWSGRITSNPVAFAIQEAKPAAKIDPVLDVASGISVSVSDDGKALVATGANDKIIWKCNIVRDNQGQIRGVTINDQGQVEATFGNRATAVVDVRTGKLLIRKGR